MIRASDTEALQLAPQAALLPAQRRQMIVDFLNRHGAVTIQQLENALGASVSTLRRDLDSLADEGIVDRTHGGALLKQQQYSTFEPEFAAAVELSPSEKRSVGAAAAEALQPGQSVIFDSGSTVLEAARIAAARNIELFAVTNDVAIAQVLGASQRIRVHVLGGQLRPGGNTLIGHEVIAAAQSIRADVLLFGAHAVTAGVISETNSDVAAVKRTLLQSANSRRLLVDSSKFRPRVFMTVCQIADVDEVITDDGIHPDEASWISRGNTRLTIVKRPSR